MRALAGFIMGSRPRAILVMVLSAALPLLFWVSAAAGSLVLLRRGFRDALAVVIWALLPALVWWYFGEPRTLMVLLGALVLAAVLRVWGSWSRTLLASVVLGIAYGWLLSITFGDQINLLADEFKKLLPKVLGNSYTELELAEQQHLAGLVSAMLVGVFAALLQVIALLSLMLGRYWQALLYNPGGFGAEFRALRLPVPLMLLLLVGMLSAGFWPELVVLTPVCSVPLAFAGLALIHGLKVHRAVLIALYVVSVLFLQVVYPLLVLLAILDSLLDFRGRRRAGGGAGPSGGEG